MSTDDDVDERRRWHRDGARSPRTPGAPGEWNRSPQNQAPLDGTQTQSGDGTTSTVGAVSNVFDTWHVGLAGEDASEQRVRGEQPPAATERNRANAKRAKAGGQAPGELFDTWREGVARPRDPIGESRPTTGASSTNVSMEPGTSDPTSLAEQGVDGPGEALPHYDAVQRAFGAHDLSGVRAHIGGAAAHASRALGGQAYTYGNRIAFSEQPTVELVAHEATHVVQQRAGVSLKSIDGGASDAHEQQADEVASIVSRGESAEGLLSQIAGGGRSGGTSSAVQRKSGGGQSSAPSPERPFNGPFDIAADGMSARVRSSWLHHDAQRWLEVLRAMQGRGAVPWADEAALKRLARVLVDRERTEAAVFSFRIDAAAIAIIGLPRDAKPLVELSPAGIQVAIAGLSGPQLDFELDLDDRQPELFYAVYTAIEQFTGLHAQKLFKLHPRAASKTTALLRLTDQELAAIFGESAWTGYRARATGEGGAHSQHQAHAPAAASARDAGGASAVARGSSGTADGSPSSRNDAANALAPAESARVAAWFAHNHAKPPKVVDPSVVALIDQIDASPELASAVRMLLQQGGARERPLDGTALRDLIDRARVDVERARLGIGAFSAERTTAMALGGQPRHVDAFDSAQLPARIAEQGLVVSGRPTRFDLALDWSAYRGTNVPGFAERNWHAVVDWVFERVDVAGPAAKNGAPVVPPQHVQGGTTLQHTFELGPHEQSGTWTVHAFVYTSHFAPRHVTAAIEVKTENARMNDLRHEAFAGMEPARATTSAHRFGLGVKDALTASVKLDGNDPDADGTVTRGDLPAGFQARTATQRASNRQDELVRTQDLVEYLKGLGDPRYADALAAAQRRLTQLRDVDNKIKNDEASGWQSFELRGTYFSRQPEVPSGALDLYASVKRVRVAGVGPSVVEVQIRDHSQRYTTDTPTHTGAGATFEAAFEAATVDLAKDYPEGKVSVLGEAMDASSATATHTKKAIGFELPTTSSYKRLKDKLFNPVVQAALNVAATALMVFQPELAPVVMSIMAAQNTVRNVDDLVHAYETRTLKGGQVPVTLAQIGLDFLPFARGARILSSPARLFAFEAVNHAGLLVVMAMQTRDAIASIQENDIAALAEQYRQLLDDEKTKNASDPALDPEFAKRKAAITDGAAKIRNRVQQEWTNAIAQNGIFMVGAHILGDIQRTRVGGMLPAATGESGATAHGGGADDASASATGADGPAVNDHASAARGGGTHDATQDTVTQSERPTGQADHSTEAPGKNSTGASGSGSDASPQVGREFEGARNRIDPKSEQLPPEVLDLITAQLPGIKLDPSNPAVGIEAYLRQQLPEARELSVRPLGGGKSGASVYLVKDGAHVIGVFKIFNNTTEMAREIAALQRIRDLHLSTLQPVEIGHAATVANGETSTGAAIMEPAKGDFIKNTIDSAGAATGAKRHELLAKLKSDSASVARGLAELHAKSSNGSKVASDYKAQQVKYLQDRWSRIESTGQIGKADADVILLRLDDLYDQFQTAQIDAAYAHGDAHAGNFSVQKSGNVSVIDTETLFRSIGDNGGGVAPAETDVGRFVESLRTFGADAGLTPSEIAEIQAAFLAKYTEQYSLFAAKSPSSGFKVATTFYQANLDTIALRSAAERARSLPTSSPEGRAAAERVATGVEELKATLGLPSRFNVPVASKESP